MRVQNQEVSLPDVDAFQLNKVLLLYVPPVLVTIGTFGNVFSFIILRQSMMKVSAYFYLAILSIMDLLVLYVGLLRLWVGQLTDDVRDQSTWLCKAIIFLGYATSDLSVWLIIAVTAERYVAVCHPLIASSMCNVHRAKIVVIFLSAVFLLFNFHFFWTVDLSYNSYKGSLMTKCEASHAFTFLVNEVWPWVDASVYSFLPFVIITVLNCCIIRKVLEARRHRDQMRNADISNYGDTHARPSNENGTKLTCMLLTVSFSFLITALPTNISLIVTIFWNTQKHSTREIASFILGSTITELLMYINHSINFFLYCAAGKKFRRQFVQILCRRKKMRGSISDHSGLSIKLTKYTYSMKRRYVSSVHTGEVLGTHV